MVKKLLLTFVAVILFSSFAVAQGTIKGAVTDQTGTPIAFAFVYLQKEGNDVNYCTTDPDGKYQLHGVSAGTYDLIVDAELTACAKKQTISGLKFSGGTFIQDVTINCGSTELDLDVTIVFERPLIDVDNTKSSSILDGDAARKQPGHDVTSAIATSAGVTSIDGKMTSVRGNRADGQKTMVDGVVMRGGGGVSMASIEQVELIQGGIPAEYGDGNSFTIITTKGISKVYHGGVELMGSLEGYNNFLAAVNFTGPLVKPKLGQPARVGFLITGDFSYDKDASPARGGTWRANDDVIDYLIKNPFRYSTTEFGAHYSNAEYLTAENFHRQRVRDNAGVLNYLIQAKLDFLLGKHNNVNLSFGGMYEFSRGKNWGTTSALFNAQNNSQSQVSTWRVNARLQHRIHLKNTDSSAIKNIMYNINVNYTHYNTWTRDTRHKNNLFDYGHIGYYKTTKAQHFKHDTITIDGITYYGMNILDNIYDSIVEFSATPFGSNDQSLISNPDLVNYVTLFTENYNPQTIYDYFGVIPYDKTLYQQFGALLNGGSPDNIYGMYTMPGTVGSGYNKSEESQIGANASLSITIKDHDLKLGYIFEKRTSRYFGAAPYSLWTLMRSSANYHISQLDMDHPYLISEDSVMFDRLFDAEAQTTFDRNLRKSLGLDPNGTDWIDIDNMSPDQFSLSMFSPEELFNGGSNYISYYGYDYTGTKKYNKKTDINDFFNKTDKYGDKLYNIGAYEPIYMAMYIQDKFSINTMMFNIGLRVDRFDANQYVLNDPYLFREAYTVSEVRDVYEIEAGNAEDDWVVYVNQLDKTLDPDNASIVAYRKGHNWYDKNGAVVTDPSSVLGATGGPILKNELDPTAVSKVEGSAFSKYEPQWSIMPRLSFSFNVSSKSLFYAHYNIITVRPTDLRLDPISYLWIEKLGSQQSNIINNPNLKPSKSIDYEIGFRQAIGDNSAISISAYYSEKRDQVQCYRYTGAYPSLYYSYDNIDFGTVQGFTVGYDLRNTKNVTLRASYTLQFAKGTGSDATSSAAIIQSGQPNLRTLTNLSFDQRHKLSANLDYRFGYGTDYNGPTTTKMTKDGKSKEIKWLQNFGVNINFSAGSGLPYSRSSKPYSNIVGAGKRQLSGTINGSNMPWIYQCDIRIDKTFVLNLKKDEEGKPTKKAFLNVYLDVMNLFNFKNVIYVYDYTGNADDDGYLAASEYQQLINSQVDVASYCDYYRMRVADPYNYTMPTRVRLGVNFSF